MGTSFVSLADIRPPQRISFVTAKGMRMLERCMIEAHCLYDGSLTPKIPHTKERPGESKAEYRERVADLTHRSRSISPVTNKVPLHKFRTNEKWVVSSGEAELIGSGLRRWYREVKKMLPPWLDDPGFLLEFIRFCEKCGRTHGFRVD